MAFKLKYKPGDKVLIKPYKRCRDVNGQRIEDYTKGTIVRHNGYSYSVEYQDRVNPNDTRCWWFTTAELIAVNQFDVGL
jgi:hypothetical protein